MRSGGSGRCRGVVRSFAAGVGGCVGGGAGLAVGGGQHLVGVSAGVVVGENGVAQRVRVGGAVGAQVARGGVDGVVEVVRVGGVVAVAVDTVGPARWWDERNGPTARSQTVSASHCPWSVSVMAWVPLVPSSGMPTIGGFRSPLASSVAPLKRAWSDSTLATAATTVHDSPGQRSGAAACGHA